MFEFSKKGDLVMANKSKAISAVDSVVENESVETSTAVADKNMDVKKEAEKQTTKKQQSAPPLTKDDEIEVISLIPNVSYKDSHTGDMYKWEEVGQVEPMPFEVVQRMWQKHKNYFKSMWLKPCDDRVIKKFGLSKIYDKYDFLMDKSNYTKKNIDKICESISSTPDSLKLSLCNKVKSMVSNGDVSDIVVIRAIENSLKIDLISLIG